MLVTGHTVDIKSSKYIYVIAHRKKTMERSSNWDRSKLEKIRPDLHINIVLVQVIIGVVCCQQHEDVTIQLQVRTLYIELA